MNTTTARIMNHQFPVYYTTDITIDENNNNYIILSDINNVFSKHDLSEFYHSKLSSLKKLSINTLANIFSDYTELKWYSFETTVFNIPVKIMSTRQYGDDDIKEITNIFKKTLPRIKSFNSKKEYDLKDNLLGWSINGILKDGREFNCNLNNNGEITYFCWNYISLVFNKDINKIDCGFKPITEEQKYIIQLIKKLL